MIFLAPLCAAVLSTPAKSQVMVLGTYHMANPGLDLVKSKIRDVLLPDRQKEIADLIASLKRFKPNRIALEALDEKALNDKYALYLKGDYTLTRDEREQVGFRLATELGIMHLDAVDSSYDMDFDKPMQFLAQNDKPRFDRLMAAVGKIGPLLEEIDQKYTVPEILAIHNCDESISASHLLYTELLKANDGKDFPGADIVGDWYKRNLRIVANIERISKPGERVFVMFGSGHVKYMRDIIRDSQDMDFVSPMKYLPKPPANLRLEF